MLAQIYSLRRLVALASAALLISVLNLPTWEAEYSVLITRLLFAGLLVLTVFGVLERWPRRLPKWVARWALQIVGVAVAVPLAVMAAYFATTAGEADPWYYDRSRIAGFAFMSILGLFIAPWFTMIALLRDISGRAERNALEARLGLLQAQVEPHFLFNTLANVRELVDTGSPHASTVLNSLIAYLRAAVPQLNRTTMTLRDELGLVRAYLEVMQMRMPDRLRFVVEADPEALECTCPSAMVLTLVENAVRHGIDPVEEGGTIAVRASVRDGRCRVEVEDDGAGPGEKRAGLGTGLENLRERLALAYGPRASLQVTARAPRGTRAEVGFPV